MIESYKKSTLQRLKKAKGQLEGVIRMVEDDKYCIEVITQMLALQGALKRVPPIILESHLYTCGTEHLTSKNKDKKNKFIKELVKACELSSR